jgi:hypothetical protein
MTDQGPDAPRPPDEGAGEPSPFSREGAAAAASGSSPIEPSTTPEQPVADPAPPAPEAPYPLYGQDPTPGPAGPTTDPAAWDPPTPPGPAAAPWPPDPYQPAPPPYQPAPPPQAPYAPQPPAPYGYGYGYGPTDHPQANPALITGIIGLALSFLCGVGGVVGIAGIVLGSRAKRQIDDDPARWTGRGKANAGVVMGVIGLVILAVWLVVFVGAGLSDS